MYKGRFPPLIYSLDSGETMPVAFRFEDLPESELSNYYEWQVRLTKENRDGIKAQMACPNQKTRWGAARHKFKSDDEFLDAHLLCEDKMWKKDRFLIYFYNGSHTKNYIRYWNHYNSLLDGNWIRWLSTRVTPDSHASLRPLLFATVEKVATDPLDCKNHLLILADAWQENDLWPDDIKCLRECCNSSNINVSQDTERKRIFDEVSVANEKKLFSVPFTTFIKKSKKKTS